MRLKHSVLALGLGAEAYVGKSDLLPLRRILGEG